MSSEPISDGAMRSYHRSGHERRRTTRAIDARPKLEDADRGRAWLNGREVGGVDARYAHLGRSHD
jgi:hypothetical protein